MVSNIAVEYDNSISKLLNGFKYCYQTLIILFAYSKNGLKYCY